MNGVIFAAILCSAVGLRQTPPRRFGCLARLAPIGVRPFLLADSPSFPVASNPAGVSASVPSPPNPTPSDRTRLASRARRAATAVVAAFCFITARAPTVFAAAATSRTLPVGAVTAGGQLLYQMKMLLLSRAVWCLGVFAGLVVLGGGYLYRRATGEGLGTATFKAYSILNDVPGADITTEKTPFAAAVATCLHLVRPGPRPCTLSPVYL